MSIIVVALGGNALGNNAKEQLEKVRTTAVALTDLMAAGHTVVVTHGNGPQVGMIKLVFEAGSTAMPLTECTAMSQGYIGYHLQQAIQNELYVRGMHKPVATILTQVVVDKNDKAFQNPSKPIGPYCSEEEARRLMDETGRKYIDDAGRGWRWVVPSPKPVDICEKNMITTLMNNDAIVIASGGGGIPVSEENGCYVGVEAVIDKDYAAAKLAEIIAADYLFILTAVDRVSIHFRKPNEQTLERLTVAEAETYCAEGHFAPGSMLPKVEACMQFVKSGVGRRAIIGGLENAVLALKGESGTVITE